MRTRSKEGGTVNNEVSFNYEKKENVVLAQGIPLNRNSWDQELNQFVE